MKIVYLICTLLILFYTFLCLLLYFIQEKLIFFPSKLNLNHQFHFQEEFEEIFFKSKDGKTFNALLFKTKNPKGVIFYLHGNAGSLDHWGKVAQTYTQLDYDIFIWDYRGFGKSEGKIISEKQLLEDAEAAYYHLKKSYSEKNIIILGYSLGSGIAAYLTNKNHPKLLILQTPYHSLIEVAKEKFPFLPNFLFKYKIKTYEFLENCKVPIVIFHGNKDELIDYNSSIKLKEKFNQIQLITLENQGHKGVTYHPKYIKELSKILNSK